MATYSDIVKQISIKQFMPIYILMGKEPYYIDKLTELIEASILTDDEKIMNETTIYGKEADVEELLVDARQYPIMAPYRVIFIKEAQLLPSVEKLALLGKYLEHPVSSTIIVITYKGGTIDARKSWMSKAAKLGVVFNSEPIREYQMPPIIAKMADTEGLSIDDTATSLLIECIGSDLTQTENIMKKFSLLLPTGKRRITAEDVERVVGISKEYSVYELINAVLARDTRKANLIIAHTKERIERITQSMFTTFSNLLIYMYMPQGSSDSEVASVLGVQPFAVKSYKAAATKYNKRQAFNAIGILRKYDTMSKGVNCPSSANSYGLLQEMIYKIMH